MLTEHYNKNYKTLMKKAQGLLGDFHYGQDCVQETYEKALKYQDSFDKERGNYDRWLNSIFFNCLKKYSNFIRDKGINMDDELKDVEAFPESLAQRYPKTILKEINGYSDNTQTKDLLVAYILLGYRSDELEDLMGVSKNTTLKTVSRFKQHLMSRYKE